MKTTIRNVLLASALCAALAACTSSEEPAPAERAPEPLAEPAAAAKEAKTEAREQISVFEASTRAHAAAEKACKGCPNPTECQQALTMALRLTTAALQASSGGEGDLALREKEALALSKQFDDIAALSDECQ